MKIFKIISWEEKVAMIQLVGKQLIGKFKTKTFKIISISQNSLW